MSWRLSHLNVSSQDKEYNPFYYPGVVGETIQKKAKTQINGNKSKTQTNTTIAEAAKNSAKEETDIATVRTNQKNRGQPVEWHKEKASAVKKEPMQKPRRANRKVMKMEKTFTGSKPENQISDSKCLPTKRSKTTFMKALTPRMKPVNRSYLTDANSAGIKKKL